MKIMLSVSLMMAGALAFADSPIVSLLDYAERDGDNKLIVLGSLGSWDNDPKATKEAVFDGDTSTFFDAPSGGPTWAGVHLTEDMILSRVRYYGRKNWAARMRGCLIQGANEPDFSDAVTLHVLNPESAWGGASYQEFSLPGNRTVYRYLRIYSNGADGNGTAYSCGNAGEVEFYGYAAGATYDGALVAPAPSGKNIVINNRYVTTLSRTSVDEGIEIEYRVEAGDWTPIELNSDCADGWMSVKFKSEVLVATSFRFRTVLGPAASEWNIVSPDFSYPSLTGTWIGTQGTYGSGRTGAMAFDGDLDSFVDGPNANPFWAGLDLGEERLVVGLRYLPRPDQVARMNGARFEASNNADFENDETSGKWTVTLHSVDGNPTRDVLVDIGLEEPVSARYVRYWAPANSYGNVNEVEFYTRSATPVDAPTSFAAVRPINENVSLKWSFVGSRSFYDKIVVFRSVYSGGPAWEEIAELEPGVSAWTDDDVQMGETYYYRLAYRTYTGDEASDGPMTDSVGVTKLRQLERDPLDQTRLRDGMQAIHEGVYYSSSGLDTNLFDGDLDTFCDLNSKDWAVGVDLGADNAYRVVLCRVMRRRGSGDAGVQRRLNGAKLFAADALPESGRWSFDTALTDPIDALDDEYHCVPVNGDIGHRYYYIGKPGQDFFGNVAELELYGCGRNEELAVQNVLDVPTPVLTKTTSGVNVAWEASATEGVSYAVERLDSVSGEWTRLTGSDFDALSFDDTTLAQIGNRRYRLVVEKGDEVGAVEQSLFYYPIGTGNGLAARFIYPCPKNFSQGDISDTLISNLPMLDYTWGTGNIGPFAHGDFVMVDIAGELEVPVTGTYTITVASDDGVALFLDGNDIVNNFGGGFNGSETISLTQGRHSIRLWYHENSGNAFLKLNWSGPIPDEVIPTSQLYSTAELVTLPEPWECLRLFNSERAGLCHFNADGSLTISACYYDGNKSVGDQGTWLYRSSKDDFDFLFHYTRGTDGLADKDAKVMLLARNEIANDAPYVAVVLNLNDSDATKNGFNVTVRTSDGTQDLRTAVLPAESKDGWLRLSRRGNAFHCYERAADQSAWQKIATFVDDDGVFGRELKIGPAASNVWEKQNRLHFFTYSDFAYTRPMGLIITIR